MVKTLIGAALLLLLTTSAGAQDAPAVIANTSKAMGADGLMALTYTGVAADVNFLQTRNINGPWPLRPITNYTRTLDLTAIGSRATGSTMNQGLFGGAPVPGTFNQGITPANTTWLQQLDYWVTPWGFLEGAAANGATASVRIQKMTPVTYNDPALTGRMIATLEPSMSGVLWKRAECRRRKDTLLVGSNGPSRERPTTQKRHRTC